MYRNDSIFKQRFCLICFKEIKKTVLFDYLHDQKICFHCRSKFHLLDKRIDIQNCPTTIFYEYNDFFKERLYHYKGLGDIALAPIFFARHPYLKKKYEDFIVACVPSYVKDNERRGFGPTEELAKVFSNRLFTGLYKKEAMKQSSMKERQLSKNNFGIKHGETLFNQKVLILDDVYTSGITINACLDLIKSYHPKKIEIIILSLSPKSVLNHSYSSKWDIFFKKKALFLRVKNFVEGFLFKS